MQNEIAIALIGVIVGGIGVLVTVFKLGQEWITKDDLRHAVKELRDEMRTGFKSLDEKLDTRLFNHINDYNSHNVAPRVPSQQYDIDV